MLYLLLKEHIETGLKYLCKKETDDESVCYTYLGSGTFWKKHLKKHGNNIKTTILYKTRDKKQFSKIAKEFSIKFDVVESKTFANLCNEEGQGGNTIVDKEGFSIKMKNIMDSPEMKTKLSAAQKTRWKNMTDEQKMSIANKVSMKTKGMVKSEDHKKKLRGKRPHVNQSGSNNNNSVPIETPYGSFGSIKEASENLSLKYDNIFYKISTNKPGWRRMI